MKLTVTVVPKYWIGGRNAEVLRNGYLGTVRYVKCRQSSWTASNRTFVRVSAIDGFFRVYHVRQSEIFRTGIISLAIRFTVAA